MDNNSNFEFPESVGLNPEEKTQPEQTFAVPEQTFTVPEQTFTVPEQTFTAPPLPSWPPKNEKAPKQRRGLNGFVVAVVLVLCCVATALVVSITWSSRFERMEKAMTEKFAALEQIYKENKPQQGNTQLPETGPLTPAQVYEKNVQAVVAIHAMTEYGESSGSGFVISADGYVVTNYHVVEGSNSVEVVTPDGEALKAKLVGKDANNDVALLKVEKENLSYVSVGSSDALAVGEMVVAIGNPLGELKSTLTVGYVSGKDRVVSTDGTVINMLQTDAAINSGNSGGPLFNLKGEVVGITTAKYSGNSNSGATIEGLGFAIPMDDIVGILEDLKEYGYVTGAYLGVTVRDVDASGQSYGLPAGAYVESVVQGSAAEKAGIRAGDIIVNVGGYDVDSLTTLTRVLRRFDAEQTASITVYRSGKQEYLTITFDEKPVEQTQNNTGNNNQSQNQQPGFNFEDWFGDWFPFG